MSRKLTPAKTMFITELAASAPQNGRDANSRRSISGSDTCFSSRTKSTANTTDPTSRATISGSSKPSSCPAVQP